MSNESSTGTALRPIVQKIGFLVTVPYVDVKSLEPHQVTCSICQEDFTENGKFIAGETLNRPVKVQCGRE